MHNNDIACDIIKLYYPNPDIIFIFNRSALNSDSTRLTQKLEALLREALEF